jgi:hypothetical protein
MVLVHGL